MGTGGLTKCCPVKWPLQWLFEHLAQREVYGGQQSSPREPHLVGGGGGGGGVLSLHDGSKAHIQGLASYIV